VLQLTDMIAYALALGIAAAIPGPGMTALVARSIGSGASAGFAMLAGLIVGDLVYLAFAVFGLALIAQHFNTVFAVVRWAAIAYLLYIAWQFWTADRVDMKISAPSRRDLSAAALSGMAITLGNPKTIAFYLAILPLVIDLNAITFASYAGILIPLTVFVLIVVGGVFILFSVAVRERLSGARAQQRLHRGAAVAMASAAGSLILRES